MVRNSRNGDLKRTQKKKKKKKNSRQSPTPAFIPCPGPQAVPALHCITINTITYRNVDCIHQVKLPQYLN